MNALERAAFRHIRSFRREGGALYDAYVSAYSWIYRWRMLARHRRDAHGRLMSNGRCTWCGDKP